MLTKSIHRHLLHLIIVLGTGYYFGSEGKAELKGKSDANEKRVEKLEKIVAEKLKQPNLSVNNDIQDVKVKDSSQLHFVPKTDVNQVNNQIPLTNQKKLSTETIGKIKILQEKLEYLQKEDKRPLRQLKLKRKINRLKNPL